MTSRNHTTSNVLWVLPLARRTVSSREDSRAGRTNLTDQSFSATEVLYIPTTDMSR
jgi:hypothetical protein